MKLNTQPGDQIRIEGGTVTWLDSAGGVVATIGVSSDQGEDVPFTYDEAAHLLRPDAAPELGAEAFADGCMPKWWGWFFNITWGTLVWAESPLRLLGPLREPPARLLVVRLLPPFPAR